MSTTLSIQEAQEILPELVWRVSKDDEPCFIRRKGRPVVILVSLKQWRRRTKDRTKTSLTNVQQRIRDYQRKMKRLGSDFWLSTVQQMRLRALVEKEDLSEDLTPAEQKDLRRLLRLQEELMAKRAMAMQVMK